MIKNVSTPNTTFLYDLEVDLFVRVMIIILQNRLNGIQDAVSKHSVVNYDMMKCS